MTRSEEILARKAKYDRIERVTDDLGRVIGVKQLKPSQQVRVQELAPGLEGTTSVTDKDGKTFEVPKASPLIMAAAVVEIDGSPVAFPKNRGELDAVLDMLDEEGLKAVGEGLAKFAPPKEDAEDADAGGSEAAKNSQSTPRSSKPAG